MTLNGLHTVVIIGGGLSGIVQAKWLLHYNTDCTIVLFEQRSCFGGVWDVSGSHGVMDCTVCNVSKYLMELTDFPWPDGTVDFPHHTDVLKYVRGYAEKFIVGTGLECHFNCNVVSVSKCEDELLLVKYVDTTCDEENTLTAHHVIIANGHSCTPNYPLTGVENRSFVSHSAHYKNPSQLNLSNKDVLVVGLSFSAVDIAVDLTSVGNNTVTVLTRRGSWFSPKRHKSDHTPSDLKLPRIFTHLPHSVQNMLIKQNLNRKYFNQNNWQISNKCDPAGGSFVSSDEFVEFVRSDKIHVVHGSIQEINDDRTVLISTETSGEVEYKFDHVVFCTGYKPTFEFLSEELKCGGISSSNVFYPNLYLNMVPLKHPELLSYIGLFNVKFTSPFQVIDLQAQYIAGKLHGSINLPGRQQMETSVESEMEHLRANCRAYRGSLFLVSNYRDVVAGAIGRAPNLWFVTSPRLWIEYYLGPITWAGYNIDNPRLAGVAIKSLHETCDRAFGKNWFFKFNCFVVGSVLAVSGAVFLLQHCL